MGLGLHLLRRLLTNNGKWTVFKKGSNIARVETDSQGLYLKPFKGSGLGMVGDGLYLK